MRISDSSSDVCSSDLQPEPPDRLSAHRMDEDVGRFRQPQQRGACGGLLQVQREAALAAIDVEEHAAARCVLPGRQEACGVAGRAFDLDDVRPQIRSEEHTSELQSLMRISYDVFCFKKKKTQ